MKLIGTGGGEAVDAAELEPAFDAQCGSSRDDHVQNVAPGHGHMLDPPTNRAGPAGRSASAGRVLEVYSPAGTPSSVKRPLASVMPVTVSNPSFANLRRGLTNQSKRRRRRRDCHRA